MVTTQSEGRKKINKDSWHVRGFKCNNCEGYWGGIYFRTRQYCPYCASADITVGLSVEVKFGEDLYCEPEQPKTPTEIVEEIKAIYHSSSKYRIIDGESTIHRNENEMESLLNELKEMAEAPKGTPNF